MHDSKPHDVYVRTSTLYARVLAWRYSSSWVRWCPACCGPSDGGGLRNERSRTTAKTNPPQLRGFFLGYYIGMNAAIFCAVLRMHCSSTLRKKLCILCKNNAIVGIPCQRWELVSGEKSASLCSTHNAILVV